MLALVRPVPAAFASSLCLSPPPIPIDVARAQEQHQRYVAALAQHVSRVVALAPKDALPDSCFVEDTAVIIEDQALLTRPGAPSRRGEVASVLLALRALGLRCAVMAPPATLDGGDVLVSGETIFVGMSARSGPAAVAELQAAFPRHQVVPVPVEAGLHLKSAATQVSDRHFLVEESGAGRRIFAAIAAALPGALPLWTSEPHAANALRVGGALLHLGGRPRLAEALAPLGLPLVALDMSELEKADGGLTCLSLLAPAASGR